MTDDSNCTSFANAADIPDFSAINYFDIGVINKPQGIKGEVRVVPVTDDPERFAWLDEVTIVFSNKTYATYAIEKTWQRPPFVIIKFKGINDRTMAEALAGGVIKIPPEKALPLAEGEYYIRDLLGMAVQDEAGAPLGVLTEVLHTGANDVYAVKTPNDKQFLLPAIKQCVLAVSVEKRTMTVHLLDGLLDGLLNQPSDRSDQLDKSDRLNKLSKVNPSNEPSNKSLDKMSTSSPMGSVTDLR